MYSEETAREIDTEVNRIIDEALERVRKILRERKAALVALTDRLIEIESVESDELKQIIDDNSPGPLLVPGTDLAPMRPAVINDEDEKGEAAAGQ